ncbi:unnamed protein product [Symbiodinium sp. CCMP2592]|nr:unnamed protein product [Symbiodinium sp. CCMP2592]
MAAVLYISPSAAADMLDMLIVSPEVQDVSKHNIPPRTTFGAGLSSEVMNCTYRPDVLVRDGVMLPCWKFDSQKDTGLLWRTISIVVLSNPNCTSAVWTIDAFRSALVTVPILHKPQQLGSTGPLPRFISCSSRFMIP